jgi:hypothetical protein
MKILILRTIAHNRIWEGIQPSCHYEELSYDIIKKWEPNIVEHPLNQISYGIGIYTHKYYSYGPPKAYSETPEEHHPSLLKLEPISANSIYYGEENSNPDNIKIAFSFIKKIFEVDQMKMISIDNLLIKEKMCELNINRIHTRFPSLCFTLDEGSVKNIFNNFSVRLP